MGRMESWGEEQPRVSSVREWLQLRADAAEMASRSAGSTLEERNAAKGRVAFHKEMLALIEEPLTSPQAPPDFSEELHEQAG